jgi:asparagine synthase (glutamine-hydrolysing)
VALRALAGRFAPRGGAEGPGRPELESALRRDGPAASTDEASLALAWTPTSPEPWADSAGFCLIDGRPRTAALAAELSLDPSLPPDRLVASGYQRLGDGVLDRIEGEFALVVWDRRAGHGLLARDRLGMRPLFVAPSRGSLLFGSEIRAILPLLPSSPPPDPAAMAHWLARSTELDPRTLFSGIERVPAAHAIRLERLGWHRWRYWQPRYVPPRSLSTGEAADELRQGLTRAVGRSLEGAASPAVLLSGGLDSAAVAAMSGGRVRAYSALFPHRPDVDESSGITRVREWLGLGGVEGQAHGGSALAAGAEFLREWEVPSVSPNLLVWLPLLKRAAADGVDAMVDGEGGDELFGCAYYLVADRLRSGRPLAALRLARRLPGMGEQPQARWIRRAVASYGVRAALPYGLHERARRARGRGSAGPNWLGQELERIRLAGDAPWAWKRVSAPRWWAHMAHRLTITGDAYGAPDQLRRTGRMTGVERRHPLRDPALIELVLRLPPELAFDPLLDRPLARRALAGALPDDRLNEDRKPAFNSVLADALGGRDAPLLRELLAEPHPELASRLRMQAVGEMLAAPSEDRPRRWALDLWRIASLEMWLEHRSDPDATTRWAAPAEMSFTEIPALTRQIADQYR